MNYKVTIDKEKLELLKKQGIEFKDIEQIPEEPEVFWEPSEGDYGWAMNISQEPCELSYLYGYDNNTIYQTKEQAEEALAISKAEYRLKKACFELGGRGWEYGVEQHCCALYPLDEIYVASYVNIKYQPSWFYLPSNEACEELIKTHKQDLLLWLGR